MYRHTRQVLGGSTCSGLQLPARHRAHEFTPAVRSGWRWQARSRGAKPALQLLLQFLFPSLLLLLDGRDKLAANSAFHLCRQRRDRAALSRGCCGLPCCAHNHKRQTHTQTHVCMYASIFPSLFPLSLSPSLSPILALILGLYSVGCQNMTLNAGRCWQRTWAM